MKYMKQIVHIVVVMALRTAPSRGLIALAICGLACDAFAATLDSHPVGITGINPRLIASKDTQRIFLFAASPSIQVRTFNTATLAWGSGIPDIAATDIDLTKVSCEVGQCWGGPTFAVGENDVLHAVWGEKGLNDCDPDLLFRSAVNLKHTHYSGSTWSAPETIIERRMGVNDPECVYQFPNLAEDGKGNMLLSYMHGVYKSPGNWDEGTHYYTHGATGGWKYRGRFGAFAQPTHNAGGFGRLVLGYALPGHDHVAEIDPVTGSALSDDVIGTKTYAPYVFLAGTEDLHALQGDGDCSPDCHTNAIYYNRKTGGGWQYPSSTPILNDPAIFVPPPSGTEYTAVIGMAATPSGKRLLAFSYAHKLYLMFYDGAAWGAPVEVDTGNEVLSVAVTTVGDQSYLVVWSTSMNPDAEVWWALVPAGGVDTPDAGYDAGGPDAGPCTQCPNGCYDLDSDHDHCGRCDKQCLAGEICYQATCSYPSEIDASIPDAALTDGGAADGGQPGDTGEPADAGAAPDAGITKDGGVAKDAGLPDDAGQTADAQAPSDAGKKAIGAEPFEYDTVGCGCTTLRIE